jgi:hypothetical protein
MLHATLPSLRGSLWDICYRNGPRVGNAIGTAIASTGRGIAASSPSWVKKMPDRPALVPEEDFTEKFLCGTGPGGQKIVRI